MRNNYFVILMLSVFLLTSAGCGASEDNSRNSISGKDEHTVKNINLEAYRYSYAPDTITVQKGDTVKIHATSRDVTHGFYIKEYNINERIEKGKFTDFEFVADKAGEFDIICSVYCGIGHQNMRGKLIVKE